jgi:hypothetical protein
MLIASSLVFVEVDVTVFEDDVNLLPGSVFCQSVGSFVLYFLVKNPIKVFVDEVELSAVPRSGRPC